MISKKALKGTKEEIKGMIVNTIKTCDYCGKKIKKGETAVTDEKSNIYFCDTSCSIKNSEKTNNLERNMKIDKEKLEKQGLKEGVDFDVIIKEKGETDEEMTNKLLSNRFIRKDLIDIGNVNKNMPKERERLFKRIIEINEKLGKEFKTDFGLGGNKSNLDYAVSLDDPYLISKEILRGHPFIDGNKRTSFMIYLILTTGKKYEEILKDYYDIFQSLAK